MFNDIYGLTKAVIDGHKTMTRRFVPDRMAQLLDVSSKGVLIIPKNSIPDSMTPEQFAEEFAKHPGVITFEKNDVKEVKPTIDIREECIKLAPYKVGEVVAVAQRYCELSWDKRFYDNLCSMCEMLPQYELKGWDNKMFVRADLMPHQIRITGIKVERLQDISDEDCMKEGIYRWKDMEDCPKSLSEFQRNRFGYYGVWDAFSTPRKAFADLIDKPGVGGKGTWERNPWVFAYSFKKIK